MSVFSRFQWFLFALVVSVISFARLCTCQNDDKFDECRKLFECGDLRPVGYPFWGKDRPDHCGYPGFELKCDDDVPHITIETITYHVLSVANDEFMVAREDLWNSPCPRRFDNTTLNPSLFNYVETYQNITIYYGCSFLGVTTVLPFQFNCNGPSFYIASGIALSSLVTCETNITVPVSADEVGDLVNPTSNESTLRSALTAGFGLRWFADNIQCNQCTGSGGRCGYDSSTRSFSCLRSNGRKKNQAPLAVGLSIAGAVVAGIGIGFCLVFIRLRRKRRIAAKTRLANDVEDFMKTFGAAGPKQYSYSQIKKMTNSFADKLGEGGYGSV